MDNGSSAVGQQVPYFGHAFTLKEIKTKIGDVVAGSDIRNRAIVIQQKTNRPVQFELTADVRATLIAWLERRGGSLSDYLFPSRVDHLTDVLP